MRGEGEGPGSSNKAATMSPHGHVAMRLFSTPNVGPPTYSIPASKGDATPNVGPETDYIPSRVMQRPHSTR